MPSGHLGSDPERAGETVLRSPLSCRSRTRPGGQVCGWRDLGSGWMMEVDGWIDGWRDPG